MKVYLKIISPKIANSLSEEFVIEHNASEIPFTTLIKKLEDSNSELYHEISADGKLNPNYFCVVNNELLVYNQEKSLSLNDGDKVSISFAIGGG